MLVRSKIYDVHITDLCHSPEEALKGMLTHAHGMVLFMEGKKEAEGGAGAGVSGGK